MADESNSKLYSHYRNTQFDALFVAEKWGCTNAIFSVLKYLQRAGRKGSETKFADMSKAVWYLVYETASEFMPPEDRRLLADGILSDLRRAVEDYSCPTPIDAVQDSSDFQCELDFPSGATAHLLDESVPFD